MHSPRSKAGMSQGLSPVQLQWFESCQALVRSLAWKIHRKLPPWVEMDDLVAYGQLGLAHAAKEFDTSYGTQFTTYAYYRVRGAIMDGITQMSWFSRHAYHSGRYERMSGELLAVDAVTEANGTSDGGKADNLGWLAETSASLSIVYLASLPGEPGEILGAASSSDGVSPDVVAMGREACRVLRLMIESLPDDANSLIKSTYFDGMTMQDAAKKLGISKAWASRLHAKTLSRLARAMRLAGAAD